MIEHEVRVQSPGERFPRERQLAWALAEVASDPVGVDPDVVEMIINRVIDNAAVAAAAITRRPVAHARAQAIAHESSGGSTVFGVADTRRFSPEWSAWANGVAVRELDFHDTFLAEEYAHPGDNIPPLLAVAQHMQTSGHELVRAIATGYEVQVDLAKAISLHAHKIDHVAHLGPSVAAGIGTLLGLSNPVIYQAIGQALHVTTATRQSRKGEISSWKAYAPAFAGKMAIESIDRAMRGETSPAPIYEGEDGVIAQLLDGPDADYVVLLPGRGEAKRAILETYTKAYSAEYQAQAFIDLARRMRPRLHDLDDVETIRIRTSHHTHYVIGTGAGDPEKFDPKASRETLDHSLMYIFAVALQDGEWDHEKSYSPERAGRSDTVALWKKISTTEEERWTSRYHATDASEIAFGGHVEIALRDGTRIEDEIMVADAHPLGARPFDRAQYVAKFRRLANETVSFEEQDRFLATVERLDELSPQELGGLNFNMNDELAEEDSYIRESLMLEARKSSAQKRESFKAALNGGTLLRFPGAFNALSALLIEDIGFDGVYVSGAVVAASLGLPDIGLTSVSEVTARTSEIARVTKLATFVDCDTGFGEPMNVARSVQALEDSGAVGCHIEDQEMPKRCGHLDGKTVVAPTEMARRIQAAVAGRRDDNFVICARTDARAIEGLQVSIDRAKSYVDAGADMIFPEALEDESEFETFRRAVGVPILANMTEFGKTPLLTAAILESLGVNMVIYPVTLLRIAMGAVEAGLRSILDKGDQVDLVGSMQTRARLYDLLDYSAYGVFDDKIFNFKLKGEENGQGN